MPDPARIRCSAARSTNSEGTKMTTTAMNETNPAIDARAAQLRDEQLNARRKRIDRMFAGLLIVQYVAGILGALLVSPYAWEGKVRVLHMHVWVAILGGAGIVILPVLLAWLKLGATITRHV